MLQVPNEGVALLRSGKEVGRAAAGELVGQPANRVRKGLVHKSRAAIAVENHYELRYRVSQCAEGRILLSDWRCASERGCVERHRDDMDRMAFRVRYRRLGCEQSALPPAEIDPLKIGSV